MGTTNEAYTDLDSNINSSFSNSVMSKEEAKSILNIFNSLNRKGRRAMSDDFKRAVELAIKTSPSIDFNDTMDEWKSKSSKNSKN